MDDYSLDGTPTHPQVSPDASYWLRCQFLQNVPLAHVQERVERNPDPAKNLKPFPVNGSPQAEAELDELQEFFDHRNRRSYFRDRQNKFPDRERLSAFLVDKRFIRPWPAGAVLNRRGDPAARRPGTPIISTGAELARLFEAETPGLWHRHVLNVLLDPSVPDGLGTRLSPPRQALIAAVLDVAILSALSAVWHYKWLGPDGIGRRARPQEARPSLDVLFDYRLTYNTNGDIRRRKAPSDDPPVSPGSPRHPAYGSGHSTYAAAASHVLGCLIPEHAKDFHLLAENIGHARLWGGVHWRTDHEAGMLIGHAVGELVIEQLNRSGIAPAPASLISPPAKGALEAEAVAYSNGCGTATAQFCGTRSVATSVVQNRGSVPAAEELSDETEEQGDE